MEQRGADGAPQLPHGAIVAQAVQAEQTVLLPKYHLGQVGSDGAGGSGGSGGAQRRAQRRVEGTADLRRGVRALVAGRGRGLRGCGDADAPSAPLRPHRQWRRHVLPLALLLQLLRQHVESQLALQGPAACSQARLPPEPVGGAQ